MKYECDECGKEGERHNAILLSFFVNEITDITKLLCRGKCTLVVMKRWKLLNSESEQNGKPIDSKEGNL